MGDLPEVDGSLAGMLTDADFAFLSGLIKQRFGIHLTEHKRSLVAGRLSRMVRERGFANFTAYCDHLRRDANEAELDDLVNRISTNHTYFFRENDHFEFFRDTALPEIRARHEAKGSQDMRIWCAAASTGEEPYSIVITMREYFGKEYTRWDAGLLATDISAKALTAAREGVYASERLKGMSERMRSAYFSKSPDAETYRVREDLRRDIVYRRLNLMNETFPFKKPFDLIFCRNVMIYFDGPTRDALVKRFARWLVPGGYLLIGHSESLGRGHPDFTYVRPAVYRKVES